MQNTPPAYAKKLYSIISETYELPADNYNHHQWLKPLKVSVGSHSFHKFNALLQTQFLDPSKGSRRKTDVEKLRRHWRVILLNLSFIMYQRRWLLIPTDRNYYSNSYLAKRLGLGYRQMKYITEWLVEHDLVELKIGRSYVGQPSAARIFPKPQLIAFLWEYFPSVEQPIEAPYLLIKKPEDKWDLITRPPDNHPDKTDLATINEFLKPHHWACKGPVQLKYKNNVFQGGRLYTPFQNLSDRRIRLRINTLIDGGPIGEVDFSANHLRLNLAFNGRIDAGDDPYSAISEEAGIGNRQTIRTVMNIAIGTNDEANARKACYTKGLTHEQVTTIIDASLKVFPKLELFKGWGIYAKSFEGQILKNVMLEGVREGIVCLPVHDAVAVPLDRITWACDEMRYQWDKQMNVSGLARVSTDKPA